MTENLWSTAKREKGKILETAEQLYQYNEEYRKSVDEERLYLLYLIGIAGLQKLQILLE